MTTNPLPPTRLSVWEPLKWALFRALEKLSDMRGNAVAISEDILPEPAGQPALWVFVSTIGELNAIGPFLRELIARLSDLRLVLITDHEHYRASYLAQYPDAIVFVPADHTREAKRLAAHFPPAILLIAEIPCLPSDAPCRFSYAFIRVAKRCGAKIFLVNGWLYHYQPSCLMDSIERRLFRHDYVRLLDSACVQNEVVRNILIEHGASHDRVTVTGNIKFDALRRPDSQVGDPRTPDWLYPFIASGKPIIVAGCVDSEEEQTRLLDAFKNLETRRSGALLILAPRRPEKPEVIARLTTLLQERHIPFVRRTRIQSQLTPGDAECLLLDTIGELNDMYAASSLAYVGRNHNILEPMAYGKPTIVTGGWVSTFPSFPVYCVMKEAGGIYQIENATELRELIDSILSNPAALEAMQHTVRHALEQACGATTRTLQAIEPALKEVSLRNKRQMETPK